MTKEQAQRLLSIPNEKWEIVADSITPDLKWMVRISRNNAFLVFADMDKYDGSHMFPITKTTTIVNLYFWKSTITAIDNDNILLKRFREIWKYCEGEKVRKDNNRIEESLKKLGV